ncbi:hypothetical protein [Enterococcus sp. AZ109]|uniref:hypothetical protein n=1 Tax=Enterococcus sp. AZ109 TaxID=2774634 RepID=UPI003F275809
MATMNDILFSLEINYEMEFIYKNKHYYLGYNEGPGCFIIESPEKKIAETRSEDREEILRLPVFDGKSFVEIFPEVKMTFYQAQ